MDASNSISSKLIDFHYYEQVRAGTVVAGFHGDARIPHPGARRFGQPIGGRNTNPDARLRDGDGHHRRPGRGPREFEVRRQ